MSILSHHKSSSSVNYRALTRWDIGDKEIDRMLIMYRVEIASADFVGLAMTRKIISL